MKETRTRTYDFNQLVDTIYENQNKGNTLPSDPRKKVFTDRNGNIQIGDQGKNENLSEIRQDTFFVGLRESKDAECIKSSFPKGTTIENVDGKPYYFYSLETIAPNIKEFEFAAYYDGSYYQIRLLAPELEKKWYSAHTGHIFENGRLCLGEQYNNGQPTLKDAFTKSVLWMHGIEALLINEKTKNDDNCMFPFSVNQ